MSTGTFRHMASYSRRHWFVAGLLLFFVALSLQYSSKVRENRSAVLRWQQQLLQMMEGEDISQRYTYPNPPIMALILQPVAQLPSAVGALLWFYLKVVMTLLVLCWVFRLVETPATPFPPWAKALAVLLSLRPIMGDLMHGNVNLFILFLVIAALYAFCRRYEATAGLVLALAIACKVTPALFVPYFVWKRAWKTLAGCAIGLVLFFWIVPACFLGWKENVQQLGSWYEQMVEPYVFQGVVTSEHHNQSLPGLVYRLATHSPSFSTYINDKYTPLAYHNALDLNPQVVRWLLKGCMVGFALLVMWTCRTPTDSRCGWRLAAEFSLVALGMLLFSERTWKHHCVMLVLPFAVLAYCLAVHWPNRKLRWYLIGSLIAVVLLMASTSTSILEVGDSRAAKMAQVYGAYVWAYLVLMAALVVLLRQDRIAATHGTAQLTG